LSYGDNRATKSLTNDRRLLQSGLITIHCGNKLSTQCNKYDPTIDQILVPKYTEYTK